MPKSQRTMMMILPLVFLTVVSRFPTGLVLYWMTTNLWTVGQGLITRRLMPKPGSASPKPAGPKRSSRTAPMPAPAVADNGKPEQPAKATSSGPRRVKKKKGGARR
jgi:YidC/Oxa1 family membrane protein insertase